MKNLVLTLVFFMFLFSCKEKKSENKNIKIPKGAIVVDKNGKPIPLPKNKIVILNFMAYSCSSCMKEIPILKKVLKEPEFKGKFTLVGIVLDTDKNDISDPEFPKYANNKANFIRFPVPGTPTTYIITPKGKKILYIVGSITEKSFKEYLKKALKKYKGAK